MWRDAITWRTGRGLISPVPPNSTAVVFSVASLMRVTIDSDQFNDKGRWFPDVEQPDAPPSSYWETIEALSRASRTFDVVAFPGEVLRANDITGGTLQRYQTVVLPDVWAVSPDQHAALLEYVDGGGRIVVHAPMERNSRPAPPLSCSRTKGSLWFSR